MTCRRIRRHAITLLPDSSRVIVRPFIPDSAQRIATIIGRALALTEEEVDRELAEVHAAFDSRHFNIEASLIEHYAKVKKHVFTQRPLSQARQLLIGALFSGEYALESAALFNPSMVPHPDQSDVPAGGLRFIMSLRATGEGHISSIEFREGILSSLGDITLTPVSRFVTVPEVVPNPRYRKKRFIIKLHEMGFDNDCTQAVITPLSDEFARAELAKSVANVRRETLPLSHNYQRTLECIQWLADSNYELRFPERLALSERII
ncbi:MAG: glycosidase, partial [Verrucomicrobiaceae bacterium]